MLLNACSITVVPPGYAVVSGRITTCRDGEYRSGWLMLNDAKATVCVPCGDNIYSEPRIPDENPTATNGSLVRATSDCCCELRDAPARCLV